MECLHNVTTHILHRRNSLPRKTRELILVCLNAFDHYEFGFRIHPRGAPQAGATGDEILEALEIVGIVNLHGTTSMLPVMVEEMRNYRTLQAKPKAAKAGA